VGLYSHKALPGRAPPYPRAMDLPPGWLTDIAVLRLSGALIEDRGDHLVVTSPDNPGYHWGNFLLVTDPGARNDASRWVELFRATFPEARHLGIGLPAEPDPQPWAAFDLPVTSDEVMSTTTPPERRPAPDGYPIQQLVTPEQWAAAAAADIAENARTGEQPDDASHREFTIARMRSRAGLSARGVAAFFGAFVGDECVSDLGIVLCGQDAQGRVVARFQSVQTALHHRRRGLAGHLVGVAARWAEDHGAQRWVIATEPENPAGRLYRSLGFAPDTRSWQVERS
jgi:GNAT superfamily N-acetyltransferase